MMYVWLSMCAAEKDVSGGWLPAPYLAGGGTISVAYFKAMLLTKMIINASADRRVCLKHHTFLSDTFNVKVLT